MKILRDHKQDYVQVRIAVPLSLYNDLFREKSFKNLSWNDFIIYVLETWNAAQYVDPN